MQRSHGFTLIELIIVILLLGILSVATFSYLGFSAQIFRDVTGRDALTAQSRFAVERLSREVRNALPASLHTISVNGATCLEFMPIETGSSYLHLPTSGSAPNTMIGVLPDKPIPDHTTQDVYLFVYANSRDRIYDENSTQRKRIANINPLESGKVLEFEFTTDNGFTFQSPAQRYYISTGPVRWCLEGTELVRRDNYPWLATEGSNRVENRTLMATYLVNDNNQAPFIVEPSTLKQNNLVAFRFYFARRNGAEPLTIYHEVQVTNVP